MNDKELDKLLDSATTPRLSAGFNDRLLQTLNNEITAEKGNVVAFPRPFPAQRTRNWPVILPLIGSMAAALVGGVYLGTANAVPSFISGVSAVASVDDLDPTGFEDFETALQDNQS